MPNITAILIDSREPDFIKNLKFGGLPTSVAFLETGDILAVTDDAHTLIIERKTPDDFLNSLKDDRLFPQLARMTEQRNAQQLSGSLVTIWPFLVITDVFTADKNGKVITDRGVTGWSFSAVMGAILSIQEMGVFVVFCNGQNDYQDCILRLGKRNRSNEMKLLPPRPASILGPKAAFLAGLPGVGMERVQELLDWSDNNVGHALIGITDMEIPAPIGKSLRKNIRALLGLEDSQNLDLIQKEATHA
jgi:ERCC4-type nuclease